jgi:hypothetical protein
MAVDPLLQGLQTGLTSFVASGFNPFAGLAGLGIGFAAGQSAADAEAEFLAQQAALAALQEGRAKEAARLTLEANVIRRATDVSANLRARREFARGAATNVFTLQNVAGQLGLSGSSISRNLRAGVGGRVVSELSENLEEQSIIDELFALQQERLEVLGGFKDEELGLVEETAEETAAPVRPTSEEPVAPHPFKPDQPITEFLLR